MTAREAWLAWAACAAVSAALVFLCSSTSPLFSIMSDDSSIFLVVGKYWREGWLPYRDLWDSKGPFLFLVNAIGYSITSSPLGVALLQVVFMSATLFFTYKLLRCEFGAGRSALAAFGVFCTMAYVYGSGDTAIGPPCSGATTVWRARAGSRGSRCSDSARALPERPARR